MRALAPSLGTPSSPTLIAHAAGHLGMLERRREQWLFEHGGAWEDSAERTTYDHCLEAPQETAPWAGMSPAEDRFGGCINTSTTSTAAHDAGGWALPPQPLHWQDEAALLQACPPQHTWSHAATSSMPDLWHTPAPVPLGV